MNKLDDPYIPRRDVWKPTNPKDLVGISKVSMSVFPLGVVLETTLALMEGARKYGRHNYRAAGVLASVYFDAACRHLFAWWEGEDIDPDSGVSHIVKAIACLVVLRDSMRAGNWVDNRPIVTEQEGWVKTLNEMSKDIFEKYPDCGKHYTNKGL